MLMNEKNKLSYINNLMFRNEFLEMMKRDFVLNTDKPFSYEVVVTSKKPPVVSTEIKEVYTCYPINSNSFQIKIRSLMIEQEPLNRISVISDVCFPEKFCWPIVENPEAQLMKKINCFTGDKPSKWNLALIDKSERYHFSDAFQLAYREDYNGHISEIVQTSNFDSYRMVEYIINPTKGFETDLDGCTQTKWEGTNKAQYSIKKDKRGYYYIF